MQAARPGVAQNADPAAPARCRPMNARRCHARRRILDSPDTRISCPWHITFPCSDFAWAPARASGRRRCDDCGRLPAAQTMSTSPGKHATPATARQSHTYSLCGPSNTANLANIEARAPTAGSHRAHRNDHAHASGLESAPSRRPHRDSLCHANVWRVTPASHRSHSPRLRFAPRVPSRHTRNLYQPAENIHHA